MDFPSLEKNFHQDREFHAVRDLSRGQAYRLSLIMFPEIETVPG